MKEASVLKVRIKFEKTGAVRFVGHLDTMRYFQKAIRRSGLKPAFSEGFSPHMIMSFAAPLGVGTESHGEYFDIELRKEISSSEIIAQLNQEMAEGFKVLDAVKIPDMKSWNAMAQVAAADYRVSFREGKEPRFDWAGRIGGFLEQEDIPFVKEGKNGPRQVNLRPNIYRMEAGDGFLFLRLASASANYTRPEQVTEAYASWAGEKLVPYALRICRLEVLADAGEDAAERFVPLLALGERI